MLLLCIHRKTQRLSMSVDLAKVTKKFDLYMTVLSFVQLSKMFLFYCIYLRGEKKNQDETLFMKYSCAPITVI